MSGSSLTCQGLPTSYNTFYSASNGTVLNSSTTNGGLSVDATTDTLTIDTSFGSAFPFQTGNIVYYRIQNILAPTRYWVIRLSSTQIKLATSLSNAQAGIAADLTTSTTPGDFFGYRHHLTNSPLEIVHQANALQTNDFFVKDFWQASAYSLLQFGITEKLRIDFILRNPGVFAGVQTLSSSFSIGYGHQGSIQNIGVGRVSTGQTWNRVGSFPTGGQEMRITLQDRILTYSVKSGTSYVSMYATSALSLTEPLRFFAFLPLNSTFVSDCQITYL